VAELESPPKALAQSCQPGEIVVLNRVPGRNELDGVGARVLSIAEDGQVELQLESSEPADPSVCVPPECITILPAFPAHGVSLGFLRKFRRAFASDLTQKTTFEASESVIKRLTAKSHSSLASIVALAEAVDPDTGLPFVGSATIFVSHAWKYTFDELLDALDAHVSTLDDPASTFLWLDVFVVNQHESEEKPKIWWTDTFLDAIRSIGNTCLVLAPWDEPIPLTRAWCIWEIASVVRTQTRLDIAVPPTARVAFEGVLLDDIDRIVMAMSRVDVRKAEASIPTDRDMILRAAEQTVGLSELNELVLSRLRDWLAQTGLDALDRLKPNERGMSRLIGNVARLMQEQGKHDEAEPLYREALNVRTEQLGRRAPDTILIVNNLAWLLQARGQLEEAEALYREALEVRRDVLGPEHQDTLITLNNLGWLLYVQGKLKEAEPMCRDALEARRRVLGNTHEDTLTSVNNLAMLIKTQGRLDVAEQLYREALEGRREALGLRHPDTLSTLNNLAWLLKETKDDAAEPLCREAYEARKETLGQAHPCTLTSMNCLAVILQTKGNYEEAEFLFRDALQRRRETLGARHHNTLTSMNNLAMLLKAQGHIDEAIELCHEAFEIRRDVLGAQHPSTLTSINSLAGLLQAKGKTDDAITLYEEALRARRETLGPSHPSTIASLASLATLMRTSGQLDKAVLLYQQVVDIQKEARGACHRSTLVAKGNLADVLRERQEFAEARDALGDSVAVSSEFLGERDQTTLVLRAKAAYIDLDDPSTTSEGAAAMEKVVVDVCGVLGDQHEQARKYKALLSSVEGHIGV